MYIVNINSMPFCKYVITIVHINCLITFWIYGKSWITVCLKILKLNVLLSEKKSLSGLSVIRLCLLWWKFQMNIHPSDVCWWNNMHSNEWWISWPQNRKEIVYCVLNKSSKAVINFCLASWLHFAFFFVIIEDIHRNVKRIEWLWTVKEENLWNAY